MCSVAEVTSILDILCVTKPIFAVLLQFKYKKITSIMIEGLNITNMLSYITVYFCWFECGN